MKKIQRAALGLALLAVLAGGGAGVSAKSSNGNRQRPLSGIVQTIDLRARTVEVREQQTGRVVTVRVPEGALLRTNITNQPFMQLERLIPGMSLTAIVE